MKRKVTTQETLTELAAAKLKLETMQQFLVLREQLLSSKDEQINFQIFTIQEKDKVINQKENEIQQLKVENENQQLKILSLEERLRTQINYRFGTHSEKSFEQLSLFDDLDDDFFPEVEMLTTEELQETIEENKKNIIQHGIATTGLLSYIFINKYCNHIPYYRQSKNFERR